MIARASLIRVIASKRLRSGSTKVDGRRCLASDRHDPTSSDRRAEEQRELLRQAGALSRSLYRICLRSAQLLRHASATDEADFARREEDRLASLTPSSSSSDSRLSMLSMLPPVNRVDELESRCAYYSDYARENFVQESDCFELSFDQSSVARFFHHWRDGDRQRKWLLQDMDFDDSFQDLVPYAKVDQLEVQMMDFLARSDANQAPPRRPNQHLWDEEDDDEDPFSDDDEEDERDMYLETQRRNNR